MIGLAGVAGAQEQSNYGGFSGPVVSYDFRIGEFSGPNSVRRGSSLTLKVINVNRLRFGTRLSGADDAPLFMTVPSLITSGILKPSIVGTPRNLKNALDALALLSDVVAICRQVYDAAYRADMPKDARTGIARATHIKVNSGRLREIAFPQVGASGVFRRQGKPASQLHPGDISRIGAMALGAVRREAAGIAILGKSTEAEQVSAQLAAVVAKESDYTKAFTATEMIWKSADDGSLFTVVQGPIRVTSDSFTIKVEFFQPKAAPSGDVVPEPAANEVAGRVATKTLLTTISGLSEMKVDFSTGVVYSPLKDPSYRAVPIPGSANQYNIVEGAKDDAFVAPAAFTHFTFLRTENVAVNLQFGVALRTKDQYGFLGGVGFAAGRSQRITVNIGQMFSRVNRLNGVSLGGPTGIGSDLTRGVFRNNWYFGLGFNY